MDADVDAGRDPRGATRRPTTLLLWNEPRLIFAATASPLAVNAGFGEFQAGSQVVPEQVLGWSGRRGAIAMGLRTAQVSTEPSYPGLNVMLDWFELVVIRTRFPESQFHSSAVLIDSSSCSCVDVYLRLRLHYVGSLVGYYGALVVHGVFMGTP